MSVEQLLWTQSWQIAMVTALAWLLTRTVARHHAHLQYALWLVVLVKCLTPPLWSSPTGIFSWSLSSSPRQLTHAPSTSPFQPSGARSETHQALIPPVAHEARTTEKRPAAIVPPPKTVVEPRVTAPRPQVSWTIILLATWLGTALVFLATTLTLALRFARQLLRNQVPTEDLQSLTDALRTKLGVARPVRLVITRSAVGPAVVGLFRPWIVVPELLTRRLQVAELQPIIAHELVHIRRGDLWIGLLRHAVRAMWWFHPCVWKASRALRQGAERCCDEEVVSALNLAPESYADVLVSVLESKQQLKPVPVVPGVRPFDITSSRLEKIMRLRQGSRPRCPRWCWAIAGAFALLTLPGAAQMWGEPIEEARALPRQSSPWRQPRQSTPSAPGTSVLLQCVFFGGSSSSLHALHEAWQDLPPAAPLSAPLPFDAQPGPQRPREWGESRIVVNRHQPIRYALIPTGELQELLQRAAQASDVNVLSRPQLMTTPDRDGTVQIGNRRSFLTGFDQQDQPQVTTVDLGLTARLRPQLTPGGIHLHYALAHARVREFDQRKVTRPNDEVVTLKIPTEVATTTVRGVNRILSGHTLLVLAGTNTAGQDDDLLACITPSVLSVDRSSATLPPTAQHPGAERVRLPWGLLRRERPAERRLEPGDVLGVYIQGIHDGDLPPVNLPQGNDVPPSVGFPIPLRSDGTLPLPFIDDPQLAGLTVEEAERKIIATYQEDAILQQDQSVIVTLVRPRHIDVLVFREDSQRRSTVSEQLAAHSAILQRRESAGRGFGLKLPAQDADVLEALAASGGLPGPHVGELWIYRQSAPAIAERIPLHYAAGQAPQLTSRQVSLGDGDILVVPASNKAAKPHRRMAQAPPLPHAVPIPRAPSTPLQPVQDRASAATRATVPQAPQAAVPVPQVSAPQPVPAVAPQQRLPAAPPRPIPSAPPAAEKAPRAPVQPPAALPAVPSQNSARRKVSRQQCIQLALANRLGLLVEANPDFVADAPRWIVRAGAQPQPLEPLDTGPFALEQLVLTRLMRTSQAYWELAYEHHRLNTLRTEFASAHRLWQVTHSRQQTGLEGGEAAREALARAHYFSVRAQLHAGEQSLRRAESRLREEIGLPPSDGQLLEPSDSLAALRVDCSSETINAALESSLPMRRQRDRVLQLADQLHRAPENGDASARMAEVKTQLARQEARLANTAKEVRHTLAVACRQVEHLRQLLDTNQNAMRAYRDQVQTSETAFEMTQSVPLELVLEAQARMAQSELAYFRTLVDYQSAVADLQQKQGTVLAAAQLRLAL